MAIYTGTEHFYRRNPEEVADVLRHKGFKEEWSIITPFQQEIKMYHKIQNKFALLRKQGKHTVVNYSR
jgi:hypothetical protein|nr:MAG TPA: hypothetical protein [Caudoviricetes sp.]